MSSIDQQTSSPPEGLGMSRGFRHFGITGLAARKAAQSAAAGIAWAARFGAGMCATRIAAQTSRCVASRGGMLPSKIRDVGIRGGPNHKVDRFEGQTDFVHFRISAYKARRTVIEKAPVRATKDAHLHPLPRAGRPGGQPRIRLRSGGRSGGALFEAGQLLPRLSSVDPETAPGTRGGEAGGVWGCRRGQRGKDCAVARTAVPCCGNQEGLPPQTKFWYLLARHRRAAITRLTGVLVSSLTMKNARVQEDPDAVCDAMDSLEVRPPPRSKVMRCLFAPP